jgi:hypothetical protein
MTYGLTTFGSINRMCAHTRRSFAAKRVHSPASMPSRRDCR